MFERWNGPLVELAWLSFEQVEHVWNWLSPHSNWFPLWSAMAPDPLRTSSTNSGHRQPHRFSCQDVITKMSRIWPQWLQWLKQADVIVHQNHKNTFFLPSIRTSQIASRVEYVSRKIKLVHHQDHQDHHFQDQNAPHRPAQHQRTSEVWSLGLKGRYSCFVQSQA